MKNEQSLNRRQRPLGIFILCTFFLLLAFVSQNFSADHKEGGYVGTSGEGHPTVVYNFLKHFNYEQYYWAEDFQFTSYNNYRVDGMTFSIFAGHGSPWYILCQSNGVDLSSAGSTSHKGYGDKNCKFVAFESCKVVPSPLEVSDWASNWTNTNGVFDGVHQILGFRTDSWQSTDQKITNYFGSRIHNGAAVWQAWFSAINKKGKRKWSWSCWCYKLKEFGSAVMWPPADGDTYSTWCSDPPENHTWLKIWYQH